MLSIFKLSCGQAVRIERNGQPRREMHLQSLFIWQKIKVGIYKDVQSSHDTGVEMKYIFSAAHSSQITEVGVLLGYSMLGNNENNLFFTNYSSHVPMAAAVFIYISTWVP